MNDPLGLSIGVANLVAARTSSAPVTRRSVLTLFGHRTPEVGDADENPNLNEPGLLLSGFVERVGDSEPLIAADGSTHAADALAAAALHAMASTIGHGAPVAIAVPAHWNEHQVAMLRGALRGYPALGIDGAPPTFIRDTTAALAALYAKPGFPSDGIVVLCDFGASGSSVTLTDAASNFRQLAPTLRYPDFSGNQIDQMILRRLAARADAEGAGTAPLTPVGRRLSQCRSAKEQLSAATVTVISADLPGIGEDSRLTRGELEDLISEPLQRFISCVEEVLHRNRIPADKLAAIATVGGGANIPLITGRLSERLHAPIVTTAQPKLSAAIGAAVLAQLRSSAGAAPPAIAVSDPAIGVGDEAAAPTEVVAATEMAPSAWAVGAVAAAAGESVADGDQSATYRALAWSQEAAGDEAPIAPVGGDYDGREHAAAEARPVAATPPPDPADTAPRRARWYKRSPVLLGITGLGAAALLVGAILVVRLVAATPRKPTDNFRDITPPVESSRFEPPPPPPPATVTVTSPSVEPSTTAPPSPVATTQPPVTTTYPTTTTYPPTTTYPTTTYPTTTPYPTTTTYPAYPTTTYPTYPTTPYPRNPYPAPAPYPTVPKTPVPALPP
ncbi:Hsp70 family protein [Mycobacterium angelicum]|uniref:Molecular chaperone n=1 Tax=Mycobacterium angelicum TaxID=470074 RepID=A0A1X0A428_MYCAN|nr:Hsp70 family protein [Mycobacterium angelicum]MCV7197837.1 Hsp70 family protein [Mycobacterium angelicum]ORA24774.1 hypothetical protein BST12_04750 [Mycobacterium angelicum]